MSVSGAADRDPVIARGRLNPDVFKSGLARDPAVGHAVQRHATGDAKIFGAGRLAQPAGARQQHLFGVVLNPPGKVFPVRHRRAGFPFSAAVHDIRLVEFRRPARHPQFVAGDLQQRFYPLAAAIGREPHQFAAFIPVAENVGRGPAVQRAKARHVVKFIAEESAIRLHPDFFQAFDTGAAEFVIALRLAGERRGGIGRGIWLGNIRGVAADAVDHHHDAFFERRHRESAVGMRQMVRDRLDLAGLRPVQRMCGDVGALVFGKKARHVLIHQPVFHFGNRQDVAIAHDKIDVVEGDALGIQAIIDHLLVEAAGVLFARDPLLGDGECDRAVLEQTGTDVMVVGVQAEDVSMLLRHGLF